MNEILLLKGNPSRRRRSGKRRSAAQRAATRRMLAANRSRFHSNPKRRRKSKASSAVAVHHRRRTRSAHRVKRRSFSSSGGRSFTGLLKTGALMGAGALTADIGMGLIAKFMPTATTLTGRVNADGTINYTYYAVKAGLIYGIGKYGTRVTRHAPTLAAGALAVMAYELIRTFMPTNGSIPMGYFNPGHVVQGGSLGKIQRIAGNNMGRIMQLPAGAGKGAVAMATVRNISAARR